MDKGKIYAIKSHQTELMYIGSTIKPLSTRLSNHKSNYKSYIAGNSHFVSSFDIIKFEDCHIVLIEDYPCQNKEQLTRREGELIKENNCVNKVVAGRTKKEYQKEYRKDNKEQIKEHNKQKITCDCGSIIRIIEKARHLKTKKHLEHIKLTN